MKLLVIGNGAREHAIVWKLRQSPQVNEILIAPGNAGTAQLGSNLPLQATDAAGLLEAANQHGVDLTVVGPEAPLQQGVVDLFQKSGLSIAGPTQAAARLETSKAFAKEFMKRHNIPCAQSVAFDSYPEAQRFLDSRNAPVVIKADGLAAGKGVVVAASKDAASSALDDFMNRRTLGDSGTTVVIEEYLEGREISVFTFSDGEHISPLVSACDYKRAYDGDAGPNTGGMGSYSPAEFWTAELAQSIEKRVILPAIEGMAKEGHPYRGALYGGLAMTEDGPKVIEFNARLGDPEAQVILPKLDTDLVEIMQAIAEGDLSETQISWNNRSCVGIAVASGGYPVSYETGYEIEGIASSEETALVFHAGTRLDNDKVLSDGGRVLTVVGQGGDLAEARQRAYDAVKRIRFEGSFYRSDIAALPAEIAAVSGIEQPN